MQGGREAGWEGGRKGGDHSNLCSVLEAGV